MAPSLSDADEHPLQSQNPLPAHAMPSTASPPMPIAVIGMACRFPGEAENVEGFWRMCCEGKSAWSEIPKTRMNADAFFHPDPSHGGTVGPLEIM